MFALSRGARSIRMAANLSVKGLKVIGRGFAATFAARDHLLFSGLALIAYGVSFIYPPAAFIIPGVVLVGVAIFGVR